MYENGHLFSHAEITVTYIILVVVNNELLIYQYLADACIIYTIMWFICSFGIWILCVSFFMQIDNAVREGPFRFFFPKLVNF